MLHCSTELIQKLPPSAEVSQGKKNHLRSSSAPSSAALPLSESECSGLSSSELPLSALIKACSAPAGSAAEEASEQREAPTASSLQGPFTTTFSAADSDRSSPQKGKSHGWNEIKSREAYGKEPPSSPEDANSNSAAWFPPNWPNNPFSYGPQPWPYWPSWPQ
ncbi:hypothetical protein KIL84_023101 [Mauremys mutica]|uniref:Uncharacterized protein n=1 Tax=Mauremys mutica TaxID=74926 RepID=A0A9D3WQY7_9SAUR|nr:hypothetical protein KIL84_023101 [Mauremys mutica]